MSFEIEFYEKKNVPTFGGQNIIFTYLAKHVKNGKTNRYRITAQLRGIESGQVYLDGQTSVCVNEHDLYLNVITNEETLVEEAVIDLFDDKVNG